MKKLLTLITTAMILLVVSCSTEPAETSDPQAEFNGQITNVSADMNEMMATPAASAYLDNIGMMSQLPFMSSGQQKLLTAFNGFKKYDRAGKLNFLPISIPTKIDTNHFVLADYYGIYNWNKVTQSWDFTTAGDSVVVNFPTEPSSLTNNAQFVWSKYEDQLVTIDLSEQATPNQEYLPTKIKMYLKINTVTEASVDFNASYRSNGMPSAMALDLLLKPFKLNLTMTSQAKEIGLTLKLSKVTTVMYNIEANVKFLDTNYSELDDATVSITRGDLTFYIFANLDQLFASESATITEQLAILNNKNILDGQIKVKAKKVADLKFKLETQQTIQTITPYFLFTNGTSMSIEELINKLFPQSTK